MEIAVHGANDSAKDKDRELHAQEDFDNIPRDKQLELEPQPLTLTPFLLSLRFL